MKEKKKLIILTSVILGVLVVVLGLTYAAFTYDRVGNNSDLVLGDIYMHYNESDKIININNMMPSENYSNDYFEFTIDGKNTYDEKDIWYEIVLSSGEYTGDDPNRTIPIDSQMLRFKLVEVVDDNEVEIFNNRAYSDISNKRIWVDTIGSDDGNYSKTYRLYVRIYEYTNICSGDVTEGCDYYINPSDQNQDLDWDKLYASIKVNVNGDFEEKSIETDASCFTYEFESIENPTVNPIMASQDIVEKNELSKCIDYLNEVGTYNLYEGETVLDFCQGTGTLWGITFQDGINSSNFFPPSFLSFFEENNIIQNNNDDTYTVNPVMATQEIIDNELTRCVNYFSSNSDFTLSDGEDYTSFCQGTGTLNGSTFQTSLDNGILNDYSTELANLNIIKATGGTIKLASYNQKCGSDVVIPKEIDGYKIQRVLSIKNSEYNISMFKDKNVKNITLLDNIVEIGDFAFYWSEIETIVIPNSVTTIGKFAFSNNQLTSVEIPNSVTTIDDDVFSGNQLTSVEIPNSVTKIGDYAFGDNQLKNVEIPNSVTTIGVSAFSGNQLTSVEIPNSVTTIGHSAFAYNQLKNVEIPNSVISIGERAFEENDLRNVTIGNGIQYMDNLIFEKNSISNPNLESITFTSKTCEEIKNITAYEGSTTKYFPWLYYSSPYYLEGYKANIIGTDGVCSY